MYKKDSTKKQYLFRKSYLDQRLQHDVMDSGVAYIPCKVKSIDDVISRYSVKGCESLDNEFLTYIVDFVDFIPVEYPVVLQITGPGFTEDEKETIIDTVTAEMDYRLGKTEEFLNIKKRRFIFMIAGTVISWIILAVAKLFLGNVPLEFFFVLFWLFADATVRYLFIDKLDFKDEKIRMGRLAAMKVEFVRQDE